MGLSDADIPKLSRYVSRQFPQSNQDASAQHAPSRTGKWIYLDDIASKRAPACNSCHALEGVGLAAEFPRLLVQYARYIAKQLRRTDRAIGSAPPTR